MLITVSRWLLFFSESTERVLSSPSFAAIEVFVEWTL
jgi:hypothetical protein